MRTPALLALIAILGCSDSPTQPGRFGQPVTISVTPVYPATDDVQRLDAAILQNNLLELIGQIVTPDPCYDLSAYRSIAGQELRVTIVARPRAKGCGSLVDHFRYDVLSDFPDCPHVTVVYHFEGEADLRVWDNWYCGHLARRGAP